MLRKIVQSGSSVRLTLPKPIVDKLGLKKGDEVNVSMSQQNGAIIIAPTVRQSGRKKLRMKQRSLAR
jgi:antitoxin component of MazEF toxin-antitoxin module